jgi:hypothetical protein
MTNARSAQRRRLCAHLHSSGPRPVLEALLAVEAGQDLDEVLEDFGGAFQPTSITRSAQAISASHSLWGISP